MGYGGVRDAEGAPEGRSRRRRDGAPRTPQQPDPSQGGLKARPARGHARKTPLEEYPRIISSGAKAS